MIKLEIIIIDIARYGKWQAKFPTATLCLVGELRPPNPQGEVSRLLLYHF